MAPAAPAAPAAQAVPGRGKGTPRCRGVRPRLGLLPLLLLGPPAPAGAVQTVLGRVRDCSGVYLKRTGALCGAAGAFAHEDYVYVAAAESNAMTVVDVYEPSMPHVVGSVADRTQLMQANSIHGMEDKDGNLYMVVVAAGDFPDNRAHVTVVDVGADTWYRDPSTSNRLRVRPRIVASVWECRYSSDRTFPRLVGRLCGASSVAMYQSQAGSGGMFAIVTAEAISSLTSVDLRNPAKPRVLSSVRHPMLEGGRQVVTQGSRAYVVSRYCHECVVQVEISNVNRMVVLSPLEAGEVPFRLHGTQSLARGLDEVADYLVDKFLGAVVAVDKACVENARRKGLALASCAQDATHLETLDLLPPRLLNAFTFQPDGATSLVHEELRHLNA